MKLERKHISIALTLGILSITLYFCFFVGVFQVNIHERGAIIPIALKQRSFEVSVKGKSFEVHSSDTNLYKSKWYVDYDLRGVFAGNENLISDFSNLRYIASADTFKYFNDSIEIQYMKQKAGVRQNFIIKKELDKEELSIVLDINTNRAFDVYNGDDKATVILPNKGIFGRHLYYKDLKVWDSDGKELSAGMSYDNYVLALNVDVSEAKFPVTIDPLSTTVDWEEEVNRAYDNLGVGLSGAGDVNGDGYSDIIAGAIYYGNGQISEGIAYVYHGSASGLSASADWTYEPDQASTSLGYSLSYAGDVNGDGYGDVVIGAYEWDNGQTDEGRILVFHGSASGLSASPDWTYENNVASSNLGHSVSTAGDVNNDGYSDIIVGGPGYTNGESGEGVVYIFHGSGSGLAVSPARTLESDLASANLGHAVSCAGDVDGDGYSDVIIGADNYTNGQSNEGKVYVYEGSASGIPASPEWSLEPDVASYGIGKKVCGAGDVNGDGYSDICYATKNYDNGQTNEGKIWVYYGSSTGINGSTPDMQYESNDASTSFGQSINCAGDVNADGYADLIVGQGNYDGGGGTDEGQVHVFYGASSGISSSPDWSQASGSAGDKFGNRVSSAGDVNGDGFSDIIISSPEYTNGNADEGKLSVYYGGPINTMGNEWKEDDISSFNTKPAGDINGDGYCDLAIGMLSTTMYVYEGSTSGLPASADWSYTLSGGGQTGTELGPAGDVNGDGYPDLVVGDEYYDNGQTDEGCVLLFYGSASGLPVSSDWRYETDVASRRYATSGAGPAGDVNADGYADVVVGDYWAEVEIFYGSSTGLQSTADVVIVDAHSDCSTAGDVNGDGYADVIVSNSDSIKAYHGSGSGISTFRDWAEPKQVASGQFGWNCATAGDVDGDGYSDIIVEDYNYSNGQGGEGAAYVFEGSSSGLAASPEWQMEMDQATAQLWDVSSAGDVNQDGYSDIIFSSRYWDNGQSNEGGVWLFLGSSTGINGTSLSDADFHAEPDVASSNYGDHIGGGGDFNGDGYSDICVSAPYGATATYAYFGNGGTGNIKNYVRLLGTDLSSPMTHNTISAGSSFGIGYYAKSILGRQDGKLAWEIVSNGAAFSGSPVSRSATVTGSESSYSDLGLTGTELKEAVGKVGGVRNKIRVRLKYDPVTTFTGQVYGPWRYVSSLGGVGGDIGVLPVELLSFTATNNGSQNDLEWKTASEHDNSHFNIQRSFDAKNWITIGKVEGVGFSNEIQSYNYSDPIVENEHVYYYRLEQVDISGGKKLSSIEKVQLKESTNFSVYPNPFNHYITVKSKKIKSFEISIIDQSSKLTKSYVSNGELTKTINTTSLAVGKYFIEFRDLNGEVLERFKVIKVK